MIVADTDLVVYLVLPGERTEDSERVLLKDPAWAAPILWRSGFRNVLATYVRAGRLELDDALLMDERAEALMASREFVVPASEVLGLAAASGCSAYDCEFVILARALGVPLVTNDRALLEAFPDATTTPRRFAPG